MDFLKFFVPAVGAVIAWFVDRHQRRSLDQYQRKEERYRELLKSLPGFYVQSANTTFKQAFLDQVNLSWLYCPDEVIRKLYAFLETTRTAQPDDVKQKALGEMIVAIRKDLLSRHVANRTNLTGSEFKILTPS